MAEYGVRLLINVTADDPQEAVEEFIAELLVQGLNNLAYNVQDRDTGVNYVASTTEFTEVNVLLAREGVDLDDDEPLLGDPGTMADVMVDVPSGRDAADENWNGSDEDQEGVCTRCGETKLLHDGLCAECKADMQGVPA